MWILVGVIGRRAQKEEEKRRTRCDDDVSPDSCVVAPKDDVTQVLSIRTYVNEK